MSDSFQQDTADSYNKVASDYAQQFQHELDHKAFDRKMLELLHEKVGQSGAICDMGCGPGQIAAYLHGLGADVCGIDLSEQMIAEAQKLHPAITFQQGTMLHLDKVADYSFGGIAAFYCIIHIPPEQVVTALKEFYRVLKAGGHLLLTFHIGTETRHFDTWFEQDVNVDFRFYEVQQMKEFLLAAGFSLAEIIQREPYPEEAQTHRAYLFAQK
jgi:ubiquinone/menaquinone biosynthesis C-methylase UbiE